MCMDFSLKQTPELNKKNLYVVSPTALTSNSCKSFANIGNA